MQSGVYAAPVVVLQNKLNDVEITTTNQLRLSRCSPVPSFKGKDLSSAGPGSRKVTKETSEAEELHVDRQLLLSFGISMAAPAGLDRKLGGASTTCSQTGFGWKNEREPLVVANIEARNESVCHLDL